MSVKNDLVTAKSLEMRIEIISFGHEQEFVGKLYSQYLDEPHTFSSIVQVTNKMDEIFNTKGFPEAFMSPRSFSGARHGPKRHSLERCDDMQLQTKEPVVPKVTFEISVKFRQNATWQGQILWVEKNVKQNFRSALEMIKLMDEALSEDIEKEEQVGWHQ